MVTEPPLSPELVRVVVVVVLFPDSEPSEVVVVQGANKVSVGTVLGRSVSQASVDDGKQSYFVATTGSVTVIVRATGVTSLTLKVCPEVVGVDDAGSCLARRRAGMVTVTYSVVTITLS